MKSNNAYHISLNKNNIEFIETKIKFLSLKMIEW